MLRRILAVILGNKAAQQALQFVMFVTQYFMGIGSGTSVGSSGESAVFRLLRQRHAAPYCVFDVGANRGQFLMVALSELPSDIQVHAFEPAAATFHMLTEAGLQEDRRVIFNNCGLGKEQGELELFYDQAGSGLASLSKRRLEHFNINFSHSELVQINTIDNYCSGRNIQRIDLLKIDVEGHELDVLKGASRMLGEGRIDMVLFEFGGCNIDTRTFMQDFFYRFAENSMSLFRVTPSGYLFPIAEYSEMLEQFRTTNYLAVRNMDRSLARARHAT